jgi:mRNA interferase MazF
VIVTQGDVFWADLPRPTGSGPGFRRPVVVVQTDALNRTSIRTAVCVPLTANLRWETALGNVRLAAEQTGLPADSVANVSQITSVDRSSLLERAGHLGTGELDRVLAGIRILLRRP